MERRRFTREFKLEAVRLIRDRGVSYAQASVHPTQLRNWVKAFADDPQHAFEAQLANSELRGHFAAVKRRIEVLYETLRENRLLLETVLENSAASSTPSGKTVDIPTSTTRWRSCATWRGNRFSAKRTLKCSRGKSHSNGEPTTSLQ
jgi:transposase